MLQFMGRENGEDYGTEFLVMLNTWEAAVKFLVPHGTKKTTIEISHFLGWTLGRRLPHVDAAQRIPAPQPGVGKSATRCGFKYTSRSNVGPLCRRVWCSARRLARLKMSRPNGVRRLALSLNDVATLQLGGVAVHEARADHRMLRKRLRQIFQEGTALVRMDRHRSGLNGGIFVIG
jgi:hypothetical protein